MNSQAKQFFVDGFIEGYQFRVVGRCGPQPIHRHDVFTEVRRYRRPAQIEDFDLPPICEGTHAVQLRVDGIHAYGRDLNELSPGMTGSLILSGEGRDWITPASALEGPV